MCKAKKSPNIMAEILSKKIEEILYRPKPLKLPKPDKSKWYVYILQTQKNTLYTGITNDLLKRMQAHESGTGSKYVKAKGFKQLLRFKECESKSDAQKAEYQIKQLKSPTQKLNWFTN